MKDWKESLKTGSILVGTLLGLVLFLPVIIKFCQWWFRLWGIS